jgi:hypothetical protein
MPSFEREFRETMGKPIKWNNIELIRIDRIPVKKHFAGRFRIVSTNSEWRQGIRMKVDGKLFLEAQEGKNYIIWADEAGDKWVNIEGTTKKQQELLVYNAWDPGRGGIDTWLDGAAMILEIDGNVRRYRCNDGHPDENFDDIIFEIIIDEATD